jgi:hypothetical protein
VLGLPALKVCEADLVFHFLENSKSQFFLRKKILSPDFVGLLKERFRHVGRHVGDFAVGHHVGQLLKRFPI